MGNGAGTASIGCDAAGAAEEQPESQQVGSQHSQALESYYAHVPGIKVVMPSTALDAKGLLKSAIRDENPVVFMEGETLYNTTWDVPEGEDIIPIGVADVKREGKDITLIA